jgi:hypothetical protein
MRDADPDDDDRPPPVRTGLPLAVSLADGLALADADGDDFIRRQEDFDPPDWQCTGEEDLIGRTQFVQENS